MCLFIKKTIGALFTLNLSNASPCLIRFELFTAHRPWISGSSTRFFGKDSKRPEKQESSSQSLIPNIRPNSIGISNRQGSIVFRLDRFERFRQSLTVDRVGEFFGNCGNGLLVDDFSSTDYGDAAGLS